MSKQATPPDTQAAPLSDRFSVAPFYGVITGEQWETPTYWPAKTEAEAAAFKPSKGHKLTVMTAEQCRFFEQTRQEKARQREAATPLGIALARVEQLEAALTTERARADRAEAALDDEKCAHGQGIDHEFELMRKVKRLEGESTRLREEVAGLNRRHLVADCLPPENENGNSAWVAVWREENEQPGIRAWDHDAEHWMGGAGTWESRHSFVQWAVLPS